MLETSWSSRKSNALSHWSKLRYVINAVAQFRRLNGLDSSDGGMCNGGVDQLSSSFEVSAVHSKDTDESSIGRWWEWENDLVDDQQCAETKEKLDFRFCYQPGLKKQCHVIKRGIVHRWMDGNRERCNYFTDSVNDGWIYGKPPWVWLTKACIGHSPLGGIIPNDYASKANVWIARTVV